MPISNFGVPFKLTPEDMGAFNSTAAIGAGQGLYNNAMQNQIAQAQAQYAPWMQAADAKLKMAQSEAAVPEALSKIMSNPVALYTALKDPQFRDFMYGMYKRGLLNTGMANAIPLPGGAGASPIPSNIENIASGQAAANSPVDDRGFFDMVGDFFTGKRKPPAADNVPMQSQEIDTGNPVDHMTRVLHPGGNTIQDVKKIGNQIYHKINGSWLPVIGGG